jgi:hypothetical protein
MHVHADAESAAAGGADVVMHDSSMPASVRAGDSDNAKKAGGGSRSKPLQRKRGWTGAIDGDCHSVLTIDLLTLACAVLVREPPQEKDSSAVLEMVGVLYTAQILQVCMHPCALYV